MSVFRREGVRVSLIQAAIRQGEKADNWERAGALFEEAVRAGPALVVFPEAFVSGVNFIILRQMAEAVPGGPTCTRLREMAARRQVLIVAGILELGDDGRVYDSAVLLDRDGDVLTHYRRRFLWIGERNYVAAGREPVTVTTAIGRMTLIVGYDLCFPQACGHALAEDVDLIVCPASVFRPLSHSAEVIAAARASDHHCYFLYANAVGFHPFANMHYGGGSGVWVDPYFRHVQLAEACAENPARVARAQDGDGVVTAEIYLSDLARARKTKLPFKGDAHYARNGADNAALPAVKGTT